MISAKPTPEEIRLSLFNAAKTIFLRDGIVNAEMKTIAAEAGLSRSTLYRYMIDKNQLAFLVATDVLEDLTNKSNVCTSEAGLSGFEKLSQFITHFADILCNNVELVSFLSEFDSIFRGDYPDIPEAEDYVASTNRMLHRAAQFLFEGMADGSIRTIDDPLFITSVIINTLFGLAERMLPRSDHYIREHHTSGERVLQAITDILLAHIKG
ncbi:MAG: TetR/AcrR family transcriptional regulator [Clostridiales bacterium]|nr:TetR/AcrR family transcriptional regulator [Clostridiales bacterium]